MEEGRDRGHPIREFNVLGRFGGVGLNFVRRCGGGTRGDGGGIEGIGATGRQGDLGISVIDPKAGV